MLEQDWFVNASEIDRIVIDQDKGMWVDIKHEMDTGDWERYQDSMLQIEAENVAAQNGNRAQRRMNSRRNNDAEAPGVKISSGNLELMVMNVVNWSGPSAFTLSVAKKLKLEHSQAIVDAIEERNSAGNPLVTSAELSQNMNPS